MAYKNFKKTEIIDELGSELRRIRKERKVTLSTVADMLNQKGFHISSTMLGRIETAERRLDDDLFLALCEYYMVDPDELIVRACNAHILTLSNGSNNVSSADDFAVFEKQYEALSDQHKEEIHTMMRLYAYMDKFKELGFE